MMSVLVVFRKCVWKRNVEYKSQRDFRMVQVEGIRKIMAYALFWGAINFIAGYALRDHLWDMIVFMWKWATNSW